MPLVLVFSPIFTSSYALPVPCSLSCCPRFCRQLSPPSSLPIPVISDSPRTNSMSRKRLHANDLRHNPKKLLEIPPIVIDV